MARRTFTSALFRQHRAGEVDMSNGRAILLRRRASRFRREIERLEDLVGTVGRVGSVKGRPSRDIAVRGSLTLGSR